MSQDQSLRELVNARLTVAAEEICALFERTISGYKEELCLLKEENQRKQQLLDSFPYLTIKLEKPQEPEEQRIKQEEELPFTESTDVCMKGEDSPSPLQYRQTDQTQTEDISSQCDKTCEDSSDTDDKHWVNLLSSAECAEFKDPGDDTLQNQIMKNDSTLETCNLEKNGVILGNDGGGARGQLQDHYKIHTDDTTFHCRVCEKSFQCYRHLQIHMLTHTSDKQHKCTVCNKIFTQASDLARHSRKHTGEKPFSCAVCGRAFSQKTSVARHSRMHTGEKPFICDVCGTAFSWKPGLERHTRMHKGEKPFSCVVCNKSFTMKCDLNRHSKSHTLVNIEAEQCERNIWSKASIDEGYNIENTDDAI